MGKKPQWWIITVGGGYGGWAVFDTEANVETIRAHKAAWEGAVAQKRLADQRKAEDKRMIRDAKHWQYLSQEA